MMTSPYRTRPHRGTDLNEMQWANLRALLRQLRRQHSWIVIARLLSFCRSYLDNLKEPRDALVMWMLRVVQNAFLDDRHKASA